MIETSMLENGLRLAVAPVQGTSFVELVLGIRVGSRYELPEQAGISHLLEHMIFRGSKEYPSSFLLNHALESLGDGLEGGTAREYSLFGITVPPENLDRVLMILADLFQRPLLEEIDTEKEIVFEEMLEELDEEGEESDAFNISRMILFGDHPMGRPVLGRRSTLEAVKKDNLVAHFERFYRPANMILVASGKVDPDRFPDQVRTAFQVQKDSGPSPDAIEAARTQWELELESMAPLVAPAEGVDLGGEPRLPRGTQGPVLKFVDKSSSQIETTISFATRGERSKLFVPAMALERILDDGLSSRLQRSLCERKGLLYDISASIEGYSDIGVMDFTFRTAAGKARQALKEVFHELFQLKNTPVDSQELNRIKARMHRDAHALFENPRAIATRAAEHIALGLRTPLSLSEWIHAIRAIDAESIRHAANDIFVPQKMAVVVEGKLPRVDRGDVSQIVELGLTRGF